MCMEDWKGQECSKSVRERCQAQEHARRYPEWTCPKHLHFLGLIRTGIMNTNKFQLQVSSLNNVQSWSNKTKICDISSHNVTLHYIVKRTNIGNWTTNHWMKQGSSRKEKKSLSSSNQDNIIMQECGWKFQQLLFSVTWLVILTTV